MLALVKPKPKLESSIQYFREHGVDTLGVAPLDIISVESGIRALTFWLQQPFATTTLYVITSTEAANRLVHSIPPNWRGKRAICVGEATSKIVQPYFDSCHFPDSQNSEGIVADIDTFLIDEMDVAILKGEGGRQLIQDYLQQKSVSSREFALYKRSQLIKPFMPEFIDWNKVDMVAVTSSELLSSLLHIFPNQGITNKALIVPSARVKAQALTLGCKEIVTSNGATNAHLLRCVDMLKRGRT
jgi:uroporphyrinogen-III synthase